MMKVAGYPDPRLREIKGADHGAMVAAAHPLTLKFIKEIPTAGP